MKVTVRRKKNVSTLKRVTNCSTGIKKPVSYTGNHKAYHAIARTQVVPRRAKRGA